MKNYCAIIIGLLLFTGIHAQTHTNAPIAHAGNNGVYIDLATDYPLGLENPIKGFLIERKAGSDKRWTTIIEFNVADQKEEFLANLTKANAFIPDFLDKNSVPVDQIWTAVEKQQSVDSLPLWRNTLLVKLALGMAAYDATAPENTDLSYRITRKFTDGKTEIYAESNAVRIPGTYNYGGITWASSTTSDKAISMQYSISGNEPPVYFKVLRSEKENGPYLAIHCTRTFSVANNKTQLLFTDDHVTANHLYYYRIVPIDYYGASGDTTLPQGAAAYDIKQISLPFDVQVNYVNGKPGLSLSWNIKSTLNIQGYNIYRGNADAGPFSKIGFASVMDTSFHDNDALPLTTYFYYIETVDRMGNTLTPSGHIPGIYRSETQPMPPMLTATPVKDGVELQLTLNMKNIRGYRIYRSSGNDTSAILISDIVPHNTKGVTTYLDKSAALNGYTYYTYTARSESNSYVLSNFSNQATARPLIETKPAKPINVQADNYEQFTMISWTQVDPSIILSTDVYRAPSANQNFTKIGSTKQSRFVDSTLLMDEPYVYKVVCFDIYGGQSDAVVVTPVMHYQSVAIDGPPALIGYSTDNTPTLEWSCVDGDQIKIYRHDIKSKPTLVATVPCNDLLWKDPQTTKGQTYFYSITLVKAGKESGVSDEVGIAVY